jgi:glucose/arabinose dehydrogenase
LALLNCNGGSSTPPGPPGGEAEEGRSYAIPADNPFAAGGGAPEIYAWGQRNPWRSSFDRETGIFWSADVGQNAWEEVNIIERGGNYGWNIREGAHCFPPNVTDCQTDGLIDPVTEYPNADGDCSITGGYVYRGAMFPDLVGTYLFGDFCSGRIRGLPTDADGLPAGSHSLLLDSPLQISSFAEGNDGEVYVLGFSGGSIFRLEQQGQSALILVEAFPGLSFTQPVALIQAPGDDQRWYLVEKGGTIFTFTAEDQTAVFADLTGQVDASQFESGLLGMAFHPDFGDNRQVFLSYTAPGAPLVSHISRFLVTADGTTLEPGSEEVILTLNQPFGNHNGGQILFGPDRLLYIGFGDGGSGGDPQGHGQNPQTLLGAILRIDVGR